MGFAIAEELSNRGAEVYLVAGPVSTPHFPPHVHRIDVTTAAEMEQQCRSLHKSCEIIVMAAAVADYAPFSSESQKIKKSDDSLTLNLKKTPDILAYLGKHKPQHQLIAGFALETDNELMNAQKKLHTKNLDFIVLNSLRDAGAGFGGDTNKITIITRSGETIEYPLKTKKLVAADIVDMIEKKLEHEIQP